MAAASGGGWNLVDCNDSRTPLPSTMLFLGRDTCDVQIQVTNQALSIRRRGQGPWCSG